MEKIGILKLLKVIPLALKLIKELISFKPNIVYFSLSPLGNAFKRDLLFVSILKAFRCNIIYHLHLKGVRDVQSPIINALYRYAFTNTSVICLSATLANDIEQVKSNAKIFICANGVDTSSLSLTPSPSCNNRTIKLLFLSNLLPLKGIKLYLDAAAKLIADKQNIEINIAGPFNDRYTKAELNSFLLAHPLLAKVTKVHGSVTGVTKWKLLNDCDVLVHPTFNDAFPLVILEAMAAGCLIVSTKQGGIPDMLNNKSFGFLLDETTVECLFEKLTYLLLHVAQFSTWSKDAIQEFNRHYTIRDFENRLIAIFEATHQL
jgi:glycosyltransferase involved in cell wall biosynthesis